MAALSKKWFEPKWLLIAHRNWFSCRCEARSAVVGRAGHCPIWVPLFLGVQRSAKGVPMTQKYLFCDTKILFFGTQKIFFGIQKTFFGIQLLFSGYTSFQLTKIPEHHTNYKKNQKQLKTNFFKKKKEQKTAKIFFLFCEFIIIFSCLSNTVVRFFSL